MADYTLEKIPPEARNLVLNPGGETSIAATFTTSNGVVVTGATDVAPESGTGHLRYTVTEQSSLAYFFTPLGPEGAVHATAFKIPEANTLYVRAMLRSDRTVWVQPQAEWYTVSAADANTGTGVGSASDLTTLLVTPIGPAIQVTAAAWSELEVIVPSTSVYQGATHWRPRFAVFKSNPAVAVTAPDLLTKVYADSFIVTDSGLAAEYFDGDSDGAYWEGIPYYSSSVLGDPPATDDVENPPDPGTDEPDPTVPVLPDTPDAPVDVPDEEVPDVPPPPTSETIIVDERYYRPDYVQAADAISRRNTNRNLCVRSDVQLGPLVMNTLDENKVAWIVSEIEGWWTLPEPDVPDQARGWFDGSFPTRGRYTARTITITGSFFPRHPSDVAAARDRLIRASNLAHVGDWFMTHDDVSEARSDTKGSLVWLSGAPLIATTNASGRTDFSIQLKAPDPIKYGIANGVPPGFNVLTLLTSGGVFPEREYPRTYPWRYPEATFGTTSGEINNAGNAIVYPMLRLAGPTTGPVRINNINTGQTLRVTKKLYPGEVLEIDTATRQVTLNGEGNFRFYLDVDVDWLMLQPGPNRLNFNEEQVSDSRTTLEVHWRSGWIG